MIGVTPPVPFPINSGHNDLVMNTTLILGYLMGISDNIHSNIFSCNRSAISKTWYSYQNIYIDIVSVPWILVVLDLHLYPGGLLMYPWIERRFYILWNTGNSCLCRVILRIIGWWHARIVISENHHPCTGTKKIYTDWSTLVSPYTWLHFIEVSISPHNSCFSHTWHSIYDYWACCTMWQHVQ